MMEIEIKSLVHPCLGGETSLPVFPLCTLVSKQVQVSSVFSSTLSLNVLIIASSFQLHVIACLEFTASG